VGCYCEREKGRERQRKYTRGYSGNVRKKESEREKMKFKVSKNIKIVCGV
jgi:hypothetical protein